jgi:acetyl-CoA acetyltransferase
MSAVVVGGAMLKFGKYPGSSYSGLASPVVQSALESIDVPAARIEAMYCAHSFGGMLVGQRISKNVGIGGIPIINVENACSGGATALHEAVNAVESGKFTTVLVVGVEKLTQFGGGTLPLVQEDREVRQGVIMPAIYAMRATRFLHERDATPSDLAKVSVKARRHGSRNPYAQFQSEVTEEQVLGSRPIASPLTLLQCCPTGDGAAAVVVTSDANARQLGLPGAKIIASQVHSGTYTGEYRDMLWPEISAHCAADAYAQAGIAPSDLDVVELHDAFSIAELIYYEALGLCEPGESLRLIREGLTSYSSLATVNPSGGLLSKGHPVGASGVAQAVEVFWQLTGRADQRQVTDARMAMSHVTGGGVSGYDHGACAIHLYEAF